MARRKPTRNISLTYAAYDAPNDQGILYPCFIGPRYRLHTLDNGNTFSGKFLAGEGVKTDNGNTLDIAYPAVTEKSVIDTKSVKVKLTDASLCVAQNLHIQGIKEGTKNCIVFSLPVAGDDRDALLNGYDVKIDDTLEIDSKTYTVTDVCSVYTDTVVTATDITGMETSNVTVGKQYNGNSEAVYVLTVLSVKTDTNGKTIVTANVSTSAGDLEYGNRNAVQFEVGRDEYLGTKGITINFSADFVNDADNSVIIIRGIPRKQGSFKEVYVNNTNITLTSDSVATVYTKSLSKGIQLSLGEDKYTAKAGIVALTENLNIVLGQQVYAVREADIHVEYRELLTEDANTLISASATNFTEFVGEVSTNNPLAFMAHCGFLAKTEAFYVIATAGTSYEDYVRAIDEALHYENVFAPIAYSSSPDVKAYLLSKLKEYNAPEVAQFRKLWFADDTTMTSVVYDKTQADDVALLATMNADGHVTFMNADIVSAGVRVGDNLVIPNYYHSATQTYTQETCTIKSIVDDNELTVESTSLNPFQTPTVVYITRSMTRDDYADTVGAKAASYDSAYINYVWADNPICEGYGVCDTIYLVATLAALRSVNAPHAPLSEVNIPGWTVSNKHQLNEEQLDRMNDKGVWIVHTDRYGETVTRHQLTTVQDGTIAEEDSAVANACNIVRSLRSMLYKYRGIANVTPDLEAQLRIDLVTALENIRTRSYSFYIGPQILGYTINELGMDPDNASRIIVDVDIDVPEPLLDGNFKFNII